ncbi:hypothetical protein, partial [Paraburkholderia xenovorans]|uniref:hypothetical protein n=1 Tax=Paraburkholderia xenovorans TaxID=36873 RepID=UPI0038B93E4E
HLVVMTPLSGRITRLPACATYLKVIDAPPNRTPAMFDVVDSATSSNALIIDAQNRPSSTIKFPATSKTLPSYNQRFPSLGALSMGARRPPPFQSQSETAESEWPLLIAGS